MPFTSAQSSENRRYLKRNAFFNFALFLIDGILATALRKPPKAPILSPKRILVANGAHLGDVIMATSVLPILKSAYPTAQIGFVVGSWSRLIVEDNPLVDFVHIVDHWRLNRAKVGFLHKLRRYWKTRAQALVQIKAQQYDIAIDLYTCFPNMIPLLWQAGIPVRIGYVSSGFGPMLTHGVVFTEQHKHETLYQSDLLRELPIAEEHFKKQHSVLPKPNQEAEREVCELFGCESFRDINYRIIHMGTGAIVREWPLDSWRALAVELVKEGPLLMFTGAGQREGENIERVMKGLPHSINTCNKLSWNGYLAAVSHAEMIYCVESMAGHIAAALDTHCVSIYAGMTDSVRWRPVNDRCEIITNPLPCAPCYQRHGCDNLQCVRGITYEQVFQAGNKLTRRMNDI